MARARNIKPGFFKNENLVELPFEHRLLFVGLWTLADKAGRLEDRVKRIKMELFPADNVDVEEGMRLLERYGFIKRYEINGDALVQILNFTKHQSPHHTEKASELPGPNGELTVKEPIKKSDPQKQDGGNPPDSLIHRFTDSLNPEVEEKVKKENPDASPPAQPAPKKSTGAKVTGTRLPENFQMPDDWMDWATDERPDIPPADMRTVAESFVDYWAAKAGAAARKVDWLATWRNWVRNQKRYSSPPPKQQKFDPTAYVNRNRVPSHDIIDI